MHKPASTKFATGKNSSRGQNWLEGNEINDWGIKQHLSILSGCVANQSNSGGFTSGLPGLQPGASTI